MHISIRENRVDTASVKSILGSGIEGKVYTCYAYSIIHGQDVVDRGWGGTTGYKGGHPVDDETLFDLASLTKPIVTATVVAQLASEGVVRLEDNVSTYLGEFASKRVDTLVARLLNHTSGLPAHMHLYRWAKDMDEAVRFISELQPEYEPGSKEVYSDLGYIVLGRLVERVTGMPLTEVARERVFTRALMNTTMYTPDPDKHIIALTEQYTDRPHGPGLVHDENCFFLGGVCGHAGLFSCLADLEKYALHLLARDTRIFSPTAFRLFLDRSNIPLGGEHSYGWFIKSPNSQFFVSEFSEQSIGHTGFTGTGIWFDLNRNLCTILLTNRVYFGRDPEGIRTIRAKFNAEAWKLVGI